MPQRNESFRKLKLNHSNALPRYIIALNCETYREVVNSSASRISHKLRCAAAITCRLRGTEPTNVLTHRLESTDDIWALITKHSSATHTTWIVAHNMLFDFIVSGMPARFETGELSIDWPRSKRTKEDNSPDNVHCSSLCIIESPPTIIAAKVGSTQGRIVFVDSANWFDASIDDLLKVSGIARQLEPTQAASQEHWLDFCERECSAVFSVFTKLIKWVKDNNFGMFRYTAPSQSMACFRHRFMRWPIYFHDEMPVKKIERAGYFGGRLEVFKLGETKCSVHQLDVNSLFPSVMASGRFPSALNQFHLSTNWCGKLPCIEWASSVAEVELDTERPIYPVRLPKWIVYPTGRFQTVLCGDELSEAYNSGALLMVRSWAEYRMKPLFIDFVCQLTELRNQYKAEGNKLYEQFVKRLMNSLYGKFGQLSQSWLNLPGNLSAEPWTRWRQNNLKTGEVSDYRSFGWQVQKQVAREEIPGTFPAISAFITAAARCRMNKLRLIAGEREVFYQAIDSLITTDKGLSRLFNALEVDNSQIGKLRHQISADYLMIHNHGDYIIGDKNVTAGLPFSAGRLVNDHARQRKLLVSDSLFAGSSFGEVSEEMTDYHRQRGYNHGNVAADGRIIPYDANQLGDCTLSASVTSSPATEAAAVSSSGTDSSVPPSQASTEVSII